jgi:polysaccharide export outer membrane protein
MVDRPVGCGEHGASAGSRRASGNGYRARAGGVATACALALAALSTLALDGCAGPRSTAATPLTTAAAATTSYKLGSGDRVRVVVFGQENLSGEFGLDGGGHFAMPLIGEIQAGGLTTRELELQIRQKFMTGYLLDPQIGVEVLNYRPFYILGEVKNPGSYPYVDGMAALNAVALAGGFTYRAKQGEFLLRRGDSAGVQVGGDHVLMPGDTITVEERFF